MAVMRTDAGVVRLLQIAAISWLAYLGLSAAIDYALKSPGPVENFFYLADGGIAVFLLGLTFWPWLRRTLQRLFLPLMILLISGLPFVTNQILARFLFDGAFPPTEAVLVRLAPFLLIGLLLTAWQYSWQYVLVFNLSVALASVGVVLRFAPGGRPDLSSGLFSVLAQAFAFLAVGFFISFMVGRMRRQQRALQEANLHLTRYAQTLEDLAVTRERSRIAQELHDTLSHALSGLTVQLEAMKAYWGVDQATARQRLDRSLAAARSGLEETRRILMALRAKPLEELGLGVAIRLLAEDGAARGNLALELRLPDSLPLLPPATEQCLYRVAQEAITNVLSHARARRLTVDLRWAENRATLSVRDDGMGFDPTATGGGEHFGLKGMRERAELVNGRLTVTSQPGVGTLVELTV
jgi:signal transduction histidine kinase